MSESIAGDSTTCVRPIDYSFEEQFTGEYWIDGKKVYQKTVALTTSIPESTPYALPHNIENIDTFISMKAIYNSLRSGDKKKARPVPSAYPFAIPTQVWEISTDVENVYFQQIHFQPAANTYVVYVTLRYTCADR